MKGVIVRIALSVFGLLTVAMLLLAIFNDKGALAVYARSLKLDAVNKENAAIEEQNKELQRENKALEDDPAAIEKIAREKLGLVKPGEVILVLPNTEENSPTPKQ
jgi:cell division protein FtsB